MNYKQNQIHGNPGQNCSSSDKIKYSDAIVDLPDADKLDLILIDGRFRVACCLKCFDKISDECVIIFDDFLNRPQYHIVLDYYTIIEQTIDSAMVVLKKNQNRTRPPQELINYYELIAA